MSHLPDDELKLLQDQSFLKAKKRIDSKVTKLLLASQKALTEYVQTHTPAITTGLNLVPRKISKGENYADLPYWVSDFPANMKGADIWTFRAVVWWGNFISFSLLLSGKHKSEVQLIEQAAMNSGIYFTIHNSPWKLEFTEDIQVETNSLNYDTMLQHFQLHDFVKLSTKENLNEINRLPQLSVLSFEKLIGAFKKLA